MRAPLPDRRVEAEVPAPVLVLPQAVLDEMRPLPLGERPEGGEGLADVLRGRVPRVEAARPADVALEAEQSVVSDGAAVK